MLKKNIEPSLCYGFLTKSMLLTLHQIISTINAYYFASLTSITNPSNIDLLQKEQSGFNKKGLASPYKT